MDDILNKLNFCYDRLQSIQIAPTVTNMEKLLQSLYDIRDVYNKLKEGAENGSESNVSG